MVCQFGASIAPCRSRPPRTASRGPRPGRSAAATGPAGRRPACRRPAAGSPSRRASDGRERGARAACPAASELGRPGSSQDICGRVPSGKPSSGMIGFDLQPAAAGRGRDHVAPAVDDVDVAGVAPGACRRASTVGSPDAGDAAGRGGTAPGGASRRTPGAQARARPPGAPGRSSGWRVLADERPPLRRCRWATSRPSSGDIGACRRTRPHGRPWPASPPRRWRGRSPAVPDAWPRQLPPGAVQQRERLEQRRALGPRPGLARASTRASLGDRRLVRRAPAGEVVHR